MHHWCAQIGSLKFTVLWTLWRERTSGQIIQMAFEFFHIVVTCAVIFHLNAALYFKISLMRGVENFSPSCDQDERCGLNETGLDPDDRMSYLSKLTTYWSTRSTKMRFSNFTKQYSLSFYWSSLTLTTSGQQPYPTQDIHNYLEIVDTVVGVLVFAVIVGSVGNVVVTMNRDRAQVQGLTDGIKFYMNYRNVSPDIQKRVIEFISYIEKYGLFCDESEILDSIPRRLQGELALHLHMETLKNVELFRDCDPSILYELVLRLTMHIYGPNDYLCRAGDVAKEMFIVKTGVLESISEHGLKISVLKEGSTFGELSLLRVANSTRSNRRIRSLRSIGYSDIYQLKQEDLLEVLKDYPEARNKLIQRAREMTRRRGATDPQAQDLNDPNQEIEGVHNVEETLSLLADSVKKIEDELNSLYFDFHDASSNNKRRMTRLETIYKQTKPQFQFYPHR
ncbi:CGMP-gated cation channel alpha-1 [Aphelenchoides bicaudatus]|nr:CGMP-gated cation channel alpha-1 [Aphelenchoides bicaudatus]